MTPYDAGPVQPIDAGVAWTEAIASAACFQPVFDAKTLTVPPEWVSLVAGHEPAVALAFCMGNFPQLVRNFHLILQSAAPPRLSVNSGRAAEVPALVDWARKVGAKKQYPQVVLALGCLRLAKNFPQAEALIAEHDALVPGEWRAAWQNEKAGFAWHQGRAEGARDIWNALEPCVPVLFNRGMADVFGGDVVRGRATLDAVAEQIPETSAWHHLARLYALLGPSR